MADGGAGLMSESFVRQVSVWEAVEKGLASVVDDKLIKGEANVNALDRRGRSLLHYAAHSGQLGVCRVLLRSGAHTGSRTKFGNTPLHYATFNGHEHCVRLLLEAGADHGAADMDQSRPLHNAAYNGHARCVRALLDFGASVEVRNKDGWNPLMDACFNGHLESVELLLAAPNGVRVIDEVNDEGVCSLYLASRHGHTEICALLLCNLAQCDIPSHDGTTALVAATQNNHPACVELLLTAKADANVTTRSGSSPLSEAAALGGTTLALIKDAVGSAPTARSDEGSKATPLDDADGGAGGRKPGQGRRKTEDEESSLPESPMRRRGAAGQRHPKRGGSAADRNMTEDHPDVVAAKARAYDRFLQQERANAVAGDATPERIPQRKPRNGPSGGPGIKVRGCCGDPSGPTLSVGGSSCAVQ